MIQYYRRMMEVIKKAANGRLQFDDMLKEHQYKYINGYEAEPIWVTAEKQNKKAMLF